MPDDLYAGRIANLAAKLEEAGVDAFFANYPVTMRYLTGFGEDAHERFLTIAVSATGQVVSIAPALSESQARRAGLIDVRGWADGQEPMDLFKGIAAEWDLGSAILAVDDTMPAHMLLRMQAALPAALFKPGGALFSQLAMNKDAAEIQLMKDAGKIADEAFEVLLKEIRPGMTEKQVQKVLYEAMTERGGAPTFGIVGAGANGAEPHHLTDDTVLKKGDVVILDFGCDYKGYQSDITRTISLGEPSETARKVYDTVYRAHMAARAAIKPGVACSAVDAGARGVIAEAGYGERFVHRTGHGIGMSVHEAPYISQDSDHNLQPGNCFSIEPGIYLPGEFGVRIENIVSCTPEGHQSMNAEPSKELIVITA